MAKNRKVVKKSAYRPKKTSYKSHIIIVIVLLFIILAATKLVTGSFNVLDGIKRVFGARTVAGYNLESGCAKTSVRPCYDKLTKTSTSILGKNAANVFTACTSNSAPNNTGEFIQKTSVCGQEKVTYCHDGKSDNFIRKFSGTCETDPPPPPQPSPQPTLVPTSEPTLEPTPLPTEVPTPLPSNVPTLVPSTVPSPTPLAVRFRLLYPNGGEQLPYGSTQIVRWEGGDTQNYWPMEFGLTWTDYAGVLRYHTFTEVNDGQAEWIVDLPLGTTYQLYAGGCLRTTCISPYALDSSDGTFSVVAGAPIEKIYTSNLLNRGVVVLSPSGGENWPVGSSQTIKWTGGEDQWDMRVLLMTPGSSGYTVIEKLTQNDGTVSWIVPAYVPPGSYTVLVGCTPASCNDSTVEGSSYGYSFKPFTIQ